MRYIPVVLALCLLLGCGAGSTSAVPVPRPTLCPPPIATQNLKFPESVLDLAEYDVLLAWAQGDLDGDGLEDLAAVVEHRPGKTLLKNTHAWDASRTLMVLIQGEDGVYKRHQENRTLVRRDTEGGVYGDPFDGITVQSGALHLHEYGGSSARWSIGYTFTWQGDGLAVSRVEEMDMSTHTGNGTIDTYDFGAGTFQRWTHSEWDEGEHRLLWEGALDQEGWPLEDVPDDDGFREAAHLPPLPSFPFYHFHQDRNPVRSAQEVLNSIQEKYHPEMTPEEFPWTEQTRANYSAALGMAVPDCWYTDGTSTLSYLWLEENMQHAILFQGPEDSDGYWIWDDTGEEWPAA